MSKEFPKLPYGLIPNFIVQHGDKYSAHVKDGRYFLRFEWDGLSQSYNTVDIQFSSEEITEYNKENDRRN